MLYWHIENNASHLTNLFIIITISFLHTEAKGACAGKSTQLTVIQKIHGDGCTKIVACMNLNIVCSGEFV